MQASDKQLLAVVAADIQFLRDEWDNDVDDDSLRRSSTVLRRLLVENDLQRSWKIARFEGQVTIRSSTLDGILKSVPLDKITFASAGGASFHGAQLRGAFVANFAMNPEQVKKLNAEGPPEKNYGLLEFVEDASVIVQGTRIRRRHIIKYVSNKLGGAHLDSHRGRHKDDPIYVLLDKVGESFMLLDKPAIYFELLSIGQAIANSSDVMKLIEQIEASK